MKLDHGLLLYEGKAKRVFSTNNTEEVLVEFKDDATAFNAQKRAQIEGKGRLNCLITGKIFKILSKRGLPTHFLNTESDTWMLVQKVNIIPLEIVVRNIASGSLCRETPLRPGKELSAPLIDLYYKDDKLGDPLITDQRIEILGLASSEIIYEIKELALKTNSILREFFLKAGILLVDFKLEMGFNLKGKLLIADEFSPDNCRLWDLNVDDSTQKIMDKDRFRLDLGGVLDSYEEIYRRIKDIAF